MQVHIFMNVIKNSDRKLFYRLHVTEIFYIISMYYVHLGISKKMHKTPRSTSSNVINSPLLLACSRDSLRSHNDNGIKFGPAPCSTIYTATRLT